MGIVKEIIDKNAVNDIKVSALFPEKVIEDRDRLKNRYLAKDGLNPMLEFENTDGTRYQVYLEVDSKSLYAMAIQIVDNYVTVICAIDKITKATYSRFLIDKITKATYSRFLKSLCNFEPLMYRLILDNNAIHTSIYYPLFEMNSLIIKSLQFPQCNMVIKEIENISSAIKNNNDDIIKRKCLLISIPLYSEYDYTGFGRSLYDNSISTYRYGTLYTVNIARIDNPKFRRYQVYARGNGDRFQTHASLINRKFGTYADTILGAVELAGKMISDIRNFMNDYYNVEKLSDTDNSESTEESERGYDFEIRKRLSEYEGYAEMFEKAKSVYREFNGDRDKIMERNESNSTLVCDYTGIFEYLRRHIPWFEEKEEL